MPNLSPSLLSVLRCPVTGSALVQDGESLVATAAGPDGITPRYAMEDGIPVLLPPTDTAQAMNTAQTDTAQATNTAQEHA